MRHRLWPGAGRVGIVVLAGLAVLAAGCSSAASGPGSAPVASLSGHAAASSAQALTAAQSDQDMISFARCMRGHGVQMSDPVHRPGHAGFSIALPTRDSATSAAYAACTHFIPAGVRDDGTGP